MRTTHLCSYIPACLVKGKQAWYIKFHQTNPKTDLLEYFRPKHGLNRLKDLSVREAHAATIIAKINALLPQGYPFTQVEEKKPDNLLSAFERVRDKKSKATTRTDSKKTYHTFFNSFSKFLHAKGWERIGIHEFTRKHALDYLDYQLDVVKICPNTWNNRLRDAASFFAMLVDDEEILEKNPFRKIKKMRPSEKIRRPFTDEEAKIILDTAINKHYYLFLAILFSFYCGLRRTEMNRLRFRDFNFVDGTILLPASSAKKWKERNITIPKVIIKYLLDDRFKAFPANYLVFGEGFKPHAEKPCGDSTIKNAHRNILLQLEKDGKLTGIKGLSFYSWKDYFVSKAIHIMPPIILKEQLGHASLDTTMKYYHAKKVLKEIKDLDLL